MAGSRRQRAGWAFAALLLIAAALLYVWMFSDSQGTIAPAPATKTPTTLADKGFDGHYITFRYKGIYLPHQLAAKDFDLELYMLSAGTQYDKRLAVAVSQLPAVGLAANSAYTLRQSQPDTYTSRQVTIGTAPATVWTKNDKSEQTAFIPHGDKVAVLAFSTASASDAADRLQPEVDALLQSFRWK